MTPADFYARVRDYMELPPGQRHERMALLHTRATDEYIAVLRRITPEQAAEPVAAEGDPRTLAQVVGHITEWERFGILAAGDVLAGVKRPRTVTSVEGFVETDGSVLNFASVDEFNRYQAEKYETYPWVQLQTTAISTARTLHTLFTHPQLLTATRLEQTEPHTMRLATGHTIEGTPMGWSLWLIYIEHEAVDHAAELGIN